MSSWHKTVQHTVIIFIFNFTKVRKTFKERDQIHNLNTTGMILAQVMVDYSVHELQYCWFSFFRAIINGQIRMCLFGAHKDGISFSFYGHHILIWGLFNNKSIFLFSYLCSENFELVRFLLLIASSHNIALKKMLWVCEMKRRQNPMFLWIII